MYKNGAGWVKISQNICHILYIVAIDTIRREKVIILGISKRDLSVKKKKKLTTYRSRIGSFASNGSTN